MQLCISTFTTGTSVGCCKMWQDYCMAVLGVIRCHSHPPCTITKSCAGAVPMGYTSLESFNAVLWAHQVLHVSCNSSATLLYVVWGIFRCCLLTVALDFCLKHVLVCSMELVQTLEGKLFSAYTLSGPKVYCKGCLHCNCLHIQNTMYIYL